MTAFTSQLHRIPTCATNSYICEPTSFIASLEPLNIIAQAPSGWVLLDMSSDIAFAIILYGLRVPITFNVLIQTEAEHQRREAGVKQSMEIRFRSCMYIYMWVGGYWVCNMYVWYLELSHEPRHVAQQTKYRSPEQAFLRQ